MAKKKRFPLHRIEQPTEDEGQGQNLPSMPSLLESFIERIALQYAPCFNVYAMDEYITPAKLFEICQNAYPSLGPFGYTLNTVTEIAEAHHPFIYFDDIQQMVWAVTKN